MSYLGVVTIVARVLVTVLVARILVTLLVLQQQALQSDLELYSQIWNRLSLG